MKSQLNETLIAAIKSKVPKNTDVVNVFMEIFPYMGKQAIYRRIRQEVPFLFEEVVRISKNLDISIDKIIGMSDNKQAVFDFNEFSTDLFDTYSNQMQHYVQLFQRFGQSQNFKICTAANTLPIYFYMPYDNFSKFRLYKWIYQTKNDPELSYSRITLPSRLSAIYKLAAQEMSKLKKLHLIIDKNLFSSVIEEIAFFYRRNLITWDEIQSIKEELLILLDRFGKMTTNGLDEFGFEASIFLSSISIDATYTYIECDDFESSRFRIHTIDGIETKNPSICKKQKLWIDSLKKFSVMISQSGEIERINFFKKQRELIMGMDNIL